MYCTIHAHALGRLRSALALSLDPPANSHSLGRYIRIGTYLCTNLLRTLEVLVQCHAQGRCSCIELLLSSSRAKYSVVVISKFINDQHLLQSLAHRSYHHHHLFANVLFPVVQRGPLPSRPSRLASLMLDIEAVHLHEFLTLGHC